MLLVQGSQIIATVILGLRIQPYLRGEGGPVFGEHLSCAELYTGHFKAAFMTLHYNPKKAATIVSSLSNGGARAPHGHLHVNALR